MRRAEDEDELAVLVAELKDDVEPQVVEDS